MRPLYDLVVIGGGPAGIFSAITAKKNNSKLKIAILETKENICNKLRITGGGRCNFTNDRDIEQFFDMVVNNPKFLYSSFYTFNNIDLKKTIRSEFNLDYVVEYDNNQKVYLKDGKTEKLIENISERLKYYNIDVYYNSKVLDIEIKENHKCITSSNGNFECRNIIVSTGGKSFPKTGSDGAMYNIIKKLGHNIVEIKPALVPIYLKERWIKNIPGISLNNVGINILLSKNRKRKVSIIDDIIFTHKGIGGPVSLKASSYINKNVNGFKLILDFCTSISKNEIREMIINSSKKSVLHVLKKIFPNNFAKAIESELNGLINKDILKCNVDDLSSNDVDTIIEFIKKNEVTPTGIGNIESATITSGGVSVKEVDSSTMESKLVKGIYFAGEVLDLDALTGGFNLQIAFSTGYLAGLSVSEK